MIAALTRNGALMQVRTWGTGTAYIGQIVGRNFSAFGNYSRGAKPRRRVLRRRKENAMKINIEVDVEWIGEEGNIDEIIKKEISDTVVNTITKKIEKEMEEKATAAVSGKVDDMCNSLISEFLKRKVTVTDKWG